MSTSRYIARLMGPMLLVMGLGMVIEHETVSKMSQEFLSNLALIYLAGILTLLAALVIVNAHNVWVQDWRVIITILGWLGIIGGVFRILLPGQVQSLGTGFATNTNAMIIGGIVTLVLGAILSWQGYEHLLQGQTPHAAARSTRTAPRRTAKRAPASKARPRKRG